MTRCSVTDDRFPGSDAGRAGGGAIPAADPFAPVTLVVTSAIFTRDPYLTVRDPGVRFEQLCSSMICWLRVQCVGSIVLCDNTATDLALPGLERLARQTGKRLEVLSFLGDQDRVATYGKGYGEGEIMRHLLNHSLLLRETGSFFKVTGRVFVENFDEIRAAEEGIETVFNLRMTPWKRALWTLIARTPFGTALNDRGAGFIQTVFYKCGVQYYRDHLLDCHLEVNDRKDLSLENRMFLPLMRHGFANFAIRPRLVGTCAGLGSLYGCSDFPEEVKRQGRELAAGGG